MVVDPENPEQIVSQKAGGVRQAEQPYTKTKHEQEARALFGVMLGPDGKGRRMQLFNYTKLKVGCGYTVTHTHHNIIIYMYFINLK